MTVAAITEVLGGFEMLKRTVQSDADLATLTREGLPVDTLSSLARELGIDLKLLAKLVGISERTLNRRMASAARLTVVESDRAIRLARVVAMATDTLESSAHASAWLQKPNRALGGQVPLTMLDTDTGVRAVEEVLGRIEFGLYS